MTSCISFTCNKSVLLMHRYLRVLEVDIEVVAAALTVELHEVMGHAVPGVQVDKEPRRTERAAL